MTEPSDRQFVSQISASFIGLPVAEIEAEVERGLQTLLEVFDTDRAIFYELDSRGEPPLSIQQAVRAPAPKYVGTPSTLRWYLALNPSTLRYRMKILGIRRA